jgi:DNA modification methylase
LAVNVLHGDCREVLATLEGETVHSVITDPPYEIGIMGNEWDGSGVAFDPTAWKHCLRVLKPGGHLLAFGAPRTYHRLASVIESVGFEIRDQIMWVYGSGFPKSLDVGKAIDKSNGKDAAAIALLKGELIRLFKRSGMSTKQLNERCGFEARNFVREDFHLKSVLPTTDKWLVMRMVLGCEEDFSEGFRAAEREVIGIGRSGIANPNEKDRHTIGASIAVDYEITAPATDAAKKWHGWGTALKPAHEPIVLARKPLMGTVAENVLTHGVGALNVEASKVNGRWPANFIHGGLTESWARYFYCPKGDRGEDNKHPTVKPLALMSYLCRLVTPDGGVVLDPFMGSGSTGKAAKALGLRFLGIEKEAEFFETAKRRLSEDEGLFA